MTIKPLTKLIIVDNVHLQNFHDGHTEKFLIEQLGKMNFQLIQEIEKPSILIFKNPEVKSSTKQTHLHINLNGLISDIEYFDVDFEL